LVNIGDSVNAQVEARQLCEALEGVLSEVPAVRTWKWTGLTEKRVSQRDAALSLRLNDGASQRWAIETKRLPLEPYGAGILALSFPARIAKGAGDYGVILAPFVSPRSAAILARAGVGYCDLVGNCRLAFGSLFIERRGHPNALARKASLRSLFTPGAGRVLRALLDPHHQKRGWTVRELARSAYPGVSVGQAHKVAKRLRQEAFLVHRKEGWRIAEPAKLLAKWGDNYRFDRSAATRYYSPFKAGALRERFLEFAAAPGKGDPRGLLASFTAADVLAPYVRQHRFFAFWSGDRTRLAKALALKPVGSGENVVILRPYDEGVFYPAGVTNEPVTCPVQTYLDLKASPARGEEAAQAVYDKYLKRAYGG
jgi:Transcriptional regulator, AbiEi antitoxin, Type IV TA system